MSWRLQAALDTFAPYNGIPSIHFVTDRDGWALASTSTGYATGHNLFRTTDGGSTWGRIVALSDVSRVITGGTQGGGPGSGAQITRTTTGGHLMATMPGGAPVSGPGGHSSVAERCKGSSPTMEGSGKGVGIVRWNSRVRRSAILFNLAAVALLGCGTGTSTPRSAPATPSSESWKLLPPAPNEANSQVLAWTGSEVLAAGSDVHGKTWGVGGEAYFPATRRWQLLPFVVDPLASGSRVEGVWTGRELVVVVNTYGGALSRTPPASTALALTLGAKAWTPLPRLPVAPGGQHPFTVGWTGTRIVVAGADRPTYELRPGERQWRPLATPTLIGVAPVAAGKDLLASAGPVAPDEKFAGKLDRWEPLPQPSQDIGGPDTGGVWNGAQYLVVQRSCGKQPLLASLNPTTDRWTERPIDPAPLQCGLGYETVWDGKEVVMLQTETQDYTVPPTLVGAALNPSTGHWRTLGVGPAVPLIDGATLWDGTDLLVFGSAPGNIPTFPVAAYHPPSPLPRLGPPPPTVSPTTIPTCRNPQVTAVLKKLSHVSNESVDETIGLTNTGPEPCTLQGTPTLELFDGQHHAIPITRSTGGPSYAPGPAPKGPIVLQAGARDSALIDIGYQTSNGIYGACATNAPVTATLALPDPVGRLTIVAEAGTSISQLGACNNSMCWDP